jgi:hypothetical protein
VASASDWSRVTWVGGSGCSGTYFDVLPYGVLEKIRNCLVQKSPRCYLCDGRTTLPMEPPLPWLTDVCYVCLQCWEVVEESKEKKYFSGLSVAHRQLKEFRLDRWYPTPCTWSMSNSAISDILIDI